MNSLTIVDHQQKKRYLRWTLNERVQHCIMAVSFILLVLTGFGLRYPNAWWVKPFLRVEFLANIRGVVHRICGAVTILLGLYHIAYMVATRRGRALAKSLFPGIQDIRDFAQNIAYNLGLRKHPPEFGHFSYIEKAEYLALIWGTIIMGGSGLLLWFNDLTLKYFPKWVADLMTVIHFYEAWLATLAIIVWHFYYVIFNPDVYPLNKSMLDGRLTEKEMRHEHHREWRELQEEIERQSDSVKIS